jgi:putative Mn2+ efflux pump MntP
MSITEQLLLALALAIDAFSVGAGIALTHRRRRQIFRLSFHFGLFQALLALLGLLAGLALFSVISFLDHWIAFVLLAWIGLRMLRGGDERRRRGEKLDLTRGWSLILLSLAVSIDAFAAGVGLAAVDTERALTVTLIGLIAGAATWAAFLLTGSLGQWLGRHGERVAGVVLIGLGLKILVEHLLA